VNPLQDFKQVWFAGVHSDVGGSYVEKTSGLAKIALEWMLLEARKAGLGIEEEKARVVLGGGRPQPDIENLPVFAPPKADEEPHKSLHGIWWLLELLPQQDPHKGGKRWHLPLGTPRNIPPRSFIHESVFEGRHEIPTVVEHRVEPWTRF
jgi:hypothetical protein